MKIELVSYDGSYPNLCSGNLVLKLDEEEWIFPDYCMSSGGTVSFDKDWSETVTDGPWTISNWPEGFPEDAKEFATEVVNISIPHGCCGGCV